MIKVASLFTQVLSLINRNDFAHAVHQCDAEYAAKGFRCWDQLVAMMFCQLGGVDSLREICGGLSTAMGKLVHLGLKGSRPDVIRALGIGIYNILISLDCSLILALIAHIISDLFWCFFSFVRFTDSLGNWDVEYPA